MNEAAINWAASVIVALGTGLIVSKAVNAKTAALVSPLVLGVAHATLDARVAHAIRTSIR